MNSSPKECMPSVLITGTSSGIGQATAVVLAKLGWRVFATMRDLGKRGGLELALKDADVQRGVEIVHLDVASGASIGAATETILSRTGNKLDAVSESKILRTFGTRKLANRYYIIIDAGSKRNSFDYWRGELNPSDNLGTLAIRLKSPDGVRARGAR